MLLFKNTVADMVLVMVMTDSLNQNDCSTESDSQAIQTSSLAFVQHHTNHESTNHNN